MGDSTLAGPDNERGTPSMVITVRATVSAVTLLSLLVCCTRLYMRKFILKNFGLDDYMVIVALILVVGFAVLSVVITFYGIGWHQDDVSMEVLATMQKIVYVSLCTYLFVATAVKSSVIIFIMRVFPQRHIQLIGKGMIVFLILLTVSGELPFIFQCKPIKAAYDKSILSPECLSPNTLFGITMYQGVLMFLADVIIIVLPMPAIWKLHLPLGKRFLILGMFSLGFLACIAALIRLPTLVYQQDATDYTYSAATSMIWMNVEFNMGLVVGSLSSLRQLFKIKSILSSQKSRRGYGSQLPRSGGGCELSGNGSKARGIMKTNEVVTIVDQKNESQERIVPSPAWGQTGHSQAICSSS